jgi:hypothetical protein
VHGENTLLPGGGGRNLLRSVFTIALTQEMFENFGKFFAKNNYGHRKRKR